MCGSRNPSNTSHEFNQAHAHMHTCAKPPHTIAKHYMHTPSVVNILAKVGLNARSTRVC